MDDSVLIYVFNICLIVGFLIPLLNLLTGWFGSFLGVGADVDLDTGYDASADVGDAGDMGDAGDAASGSGGKGGVFPFNIMCICLFLIVFGAAGHALRRFITSSPLLLAVLLLFGCAVLAGFSYFALYTLIIKRLRNSDSYVISFNELPGKTADVTLAMTAGSIGTISLRDSTGAAISFRAKIDPELASQMPETVKAGEKVLITEVDVKNKLCYVSTFFNR